MAILGNFLGGWCHSSIDLVLNWLVKIMLKRTNVQLDAQTDGKWRLYTRPLVVVRAMLTTTNGLVESHHFPSVSASNCTLVRFLTLPILCFFRIIFCIGMTLIFCGNFLGD